MGSQHLPKGAAPLPFRLSTQPPRSPASASLPATLNLWRPDNGIVFGGVAASTTTASATTTATATSRTVVQQAANAPFMPQLPRPTVIFAQQTTARFVHTAAAAPSAHEETHVGAALGSRDSIGASGQPPTQRTTQRTDEVAGSDTAQTQHGKATDPSQAEDEAKEDKNKDGPKADAEKEDAEVLPAASTLDYKIPDDLFRTARDAAESAAESFWSYTLYRHTQDNARVKVHYSKSAHTTERVCREYFLNEPVLGFDLEWMPDAAKWHGPRRNVCLVQLASPSRIGLFHVSLYPAKDNLVAPMLRRVLEDPGIIKTGVFIKGDATRLRNFLSVDMRGIFELSHLHRLVKYSKSGEVKLINKKLVSLATQVQENLRLPMFKGQDVRASDWSKPLRMDQIIYSASDAYAAVQLFSVLEKQRENLDPTPPRPALAELNLPIKLADGVTAIAAAEDAADETEQQQQDEEADGSSTQLSPEFLAEAQKNIEFEADGDGEAEGEDDGKTTNANKAPATPAKGKDKAPLLGSAGTPKPSPGTPKTPRSPATPAKPKDPRIVAAEEWLARYRASGRTVRARPASLRAYFIWHGHDEMDPVALAALLREPPLQTNTVVNYILDAVRLEGLPYHKARLRLELLEKLPHALLMSKYSGLARVCGYSSSSAGSQGHAGGPTQNSGPS